MAVNHWFQRPDVREFHRAQTQPNDRTSYVEPPPSHAGPNDRTDFQVGHARFHPGNLPDFMYELDPPQEWLDYQAGIPPQQKIGPDRNPMWELHSRPGKAKRALLDFPHMKAIDKVCTYESWWWWEMNMRLDPHFRYEDGIMRMPMTGLRARFATEAKFRNDINMRMTRGRKKWSMACWREPRNGVTGPRDKLLRTLSAYQLQNNTTRGSTPGLIDTSLGEVQGNRIPIPADKKPRAAHPKSRKITGATARLARSSSESGTEASDYDKPSDGEEQADDEFYTPEPRQLRPSRNSVNYAEAEAFNDEYSAGSQFEAVSEPPSSNDEKEDGEDDKTTAAAGLAKTKNGKTKHPHDLEYSVAQNKKRKPNENNGSGDSMTYPPSSQTYPVGAIRAARQINPPNWHRQGNRRHRAAPHATSCALRSQPLPFPNRTAIFSRARSYRFDPSKTTLIANDRLQTVSHGPLQSVSQAAAQVSSQSPSHHLHNPLPLPFTDETSSRVTRHSATGSQPMPFHDQHAQHCVSQDIENNADPFAVDLINPHIVTPQGQAMIGAESNPIDLTQRSMMIDETFQIEQEVPVQASLFPDPASWCSEWKAFIVDHNAEPILKAHILDYCF